MKKLIPLIFAGLLLSPYLIAQEEEALNTHFGLGLQLSQYQKDFGLGLNVTSPYFIYKSIAVRARGNLMFLEHYDTNGEITWTNYSNMTLGVLGAVGQIGKSIRLYAEGGVIFIIPSSDFSSQSMDVGGYGLFGFEFFMDRNNNYFIEIGGVGTGANADKVPGKPIYSNGLTISTGYRLQF